ncbi:Cation/H+ exchanger, CPA1 family [Trema orientale]|uniref:Cation/H+ exchanger, CPA1 family n=1 Tax=Trema orientale TaxID=63057 RepID=A0A2P5F1E9_TREOI|nr:Cation/H+ exchanger, CPA1 family [Trema orientale]
MLSVDKALDFVSNGPLCDWKGLKTHVNFPNYYKFLQRSICPQKLVTYFTVERLESACYICAAFLCAHRIVRQQRHDFIGDSDVASIVNNESEAKGEEARTFLEDVLRVVKTRQVTYSVLNHLIDYVQNLEKVGILEEKEMLHLHDAVQWMSKRLKSKHSLCLTFTHGSTLGLYDILTGKPYVCDIVTDSVVFCFFVETDNIVSLLRSDPSVEDFLWQESAIILVKLLLPQIFGKITM